MWNRSNWANSEAGRPGRGCCHVSNKIQDGHPSEQRGEGKVMERTEMLEPNPQGLVSNWLKRGGRQKKLTIIVTLLDCREEMEKFSKNTEEPPQCAREAYHSPKANTHRAPSSTSPGQVSFPPPPPHPAPLPEQHPRAAGQLAWLRNRSLCNLCCFSPIHLVLSQL